MLVHAFKQNKWKHWKKWKIKKQINDDLFGYQPREATGLATYDINVRIKYVWQMHIAIYYQPGRKFRACWGININAKRSVHSRQRGITRGFHVSCHSRATSRHLDTYIVLVWMHELMCRTEYIRTRYATRPPRWDRIIACMYPFFFILFHFSFFFPPHLLSSLFCSLPPSRYSDPGSHTR